MNCGTNLGVASSGTNRSRCGAPAVNFMSPLLSPPPLRPLRSGYPTAQSGQPLCPASPLSPLSPLPVTPDAEFSLGSASAQTLGRRWACPGLLGPQGTQGAGGAEGCQSFWHMYAFKELLGQGRFGEVWRCVDRTTGQQWACKELDLGFAPDWDCATESNDHGDQFDRRWEQAMAEAQCMRALGPHPGIVGLQEAHCEGDRAYLVMEHCNAGDLFDAIAEREAERMGGGGLVEREARGVFSQLAEAVRHCHASGYIHRDIKPENVLLHREGFDICTFDSCRVAPSPKEVLKGCQLGAMTVKLADFGLARRIQGGRTRGRCGSVQYTAPEVLRGEDYSYAADVWSMGILLFCMLRANWPRFDKQGNIVRDQQWAKLSMEAQGLVSWMLQLSPFLRPTLEEVLAHPWFRKLQ